MPLVPCRSCEHQVDTSALACPGCGATDPARKISRQQRQLRSFVIQLVAGLCFFALLWWYVTATLIPWAKPYIIKQQQSEQTPSNR